MKRWVLAWMAAWFGGITTLVASPSLYEGWDYPLSTVYTSADVAVLNTGIGWSAKWANQGTTSPRVYSNSVGYLSLSTNGNHGEVGWNGGSAFPNRPMTITLSANDTTNWFSWVQTKATSSTESFVRLRQSSPSLSFISMGETASFNAGYIGRWRLFVGTNQVDSGVTANATPVFVLWKVKFKAGQDDVWAWVNPNPAEREPDEGTATASWSGTSSTNIVINQLMFQGGFNSFGSAGSMDEFRGGSTYWDVVDRTQPPAGTFVYVH